MRGSGSMLLTRRRSSWLDWLRMGGGGGTRRSTAGRGITAGLIVLGSMGMNMGTGTDIDGTAHTMNARVMLRGIEGRRDDDTKRREGTTFGMKMTRVRARIRGTSCSASRG